MPDSEKRTLLELVTATMRSESSDSRRSNDRGTSQMLSANMSGPVALKTLSGSYFFLLLGPVVFSFASS